MKLFRVSILPMNSVSGKQEDANMGKEYTFYLDEYGVRKLFISEEFICDIIDARNSEKYIIRDKIFEALGIENN